MKITMESKEEKLERARVHASCRGSLGVLMRHMLMSYPRGTFPRRIRRGTKERKGSKQHS